MSGEEEGGTLEHAAFLRTAPLLPMEIDAETGALRFLGPQSSALLGAVPQPPLGPGFWVEHVVADDLDPLVEMRDSVARDGGPRSLDYRLQHAEGHVVWVSETLTRAVGADGRTVLRGYLMDVTDRKRRELSLWKQEERLRALLRSAPDAMILMDLEGRVLDMSDRAEALFGYPLSDVIGSSVDPLFPARLHPRVRDLRASFGRDPHRRSLVEGHSLVIERRDGSEVAVELSMSLVIAPDGARLLLSSVRDLTARRRAEAKLARSERRMQEMADVLPAMVCFIDTGLRYRFVNEAYATWYGWEPRQVQGRSLREVVGERAFAEFRSAVEAGLAGTANHFRTRLSGAKGATLSVDVNVVPQHDEGSAVTGCFIVQFDISDEIEAREADLRHRAELAHVTRVATLGELAASLAHELNQPLSAILANARAALRLLEAEPPDLTEVGGALDDIAASGRRAGDVIASMRDLLRKGEPREERAEMLHLGREVADLVRSEAIGRHVVIDLSGAEGPETEVFGDPVQLKQILMNLMMNAIDAAARGGRTPGSVEVAVRSDPDCVTVTVRDSGPGLPTDDPEELFAPFFTRKPDGLGMGLAISRSIVEAHDGTLHAANDPRGGAVFTVRLPAA